MSKDKIADYDGTTAGNNTDIGGISIAEGMLPSAVNNSMRELTKQLGAFADGTDGIDVLNLHDDDASASIKIQAPSTVTTTTTLTLPDGDGDSGQTLITNGSGTLAWAAPYGNRNLIIGGCMRVAQRATSATGKTSSGYFLCDRWQTLISAAGTWSLSQSTTVPSGQGFAYSFKYDCTTADASLASSDYVIHRQNLEGQDLQLLGYGASGAKTVTLSFWVRSNKTGTYVCELRKYDDTRHNGGTYTISSADTWEHKTVSFTGDTASALVNSNAGGMKVHFWLAAGSSYTSGTLPSSWASNTTANQAAGQTVNLADSTSNEWYITGVQLEVGEQATPFDHSESYGETLARCQRYFYAISSNGNVTGNSAPMYEGHLWNNGFVKASFDFPVHMRAVPTLTAGNASGAYRFYRDNSNDPFDTLILDVASQANMTCYQNSGISGTAGHGGSVQIRYADGGSLEFSAEL